MRRVLLVLFFLFTAIPAFSVDRYLSSTGDDSKMCLQTAPCKTLARALHVRQAGEAIHLATGTYTIPASENVPLIADGVVQIALPSGTIPLSDLAVWSPPPSAADIQIGLRSGGPITNAQWTYRPKSSGIANCYVDKGTKVEVVR